MNLKKITTETVSLDEQQYQELVLQPVCGYSYTVIADVPIHLSYGNWQTSGRDIAMENSEHLTVELLVDGEPYDGKMQPVQKVDDTFPGWLCRASILENPFGFFYTAQIDPLAPGEHDNKCELFAR